MFTLWSYVLLCLTSVPIYTVYNLLTHFFVDKLKVSDKTFDNTIYVYGFLGWSEHELCSYFLSYWDNYMDKCKVAKLNPVANARQRASELVASILGYKKVQYGLTYMKRFNLKDAQYNIIPKPLYKQWSEQNPINIVAHSAGCLTVLKTFSMICRHRTNLPLFFTLVLLDKLVKLPEVCTKFVIKFEKVDPTSVRRLSDWLSKLPANQYNDLVVSVFGQVKATQEEYFNLLTEEERKRLLTFFEENWRWEEDFALFYDDQFFLPVGLGPNCINKAVFASPIFKGVPYACTNGMTFSLKTGQTSCVGGAFYYIAKAIYYSSKIIPKTFYNFYFDIYNDFEHILKTEQLIINDFVQPVSKTIVHEFLEHYNPAMHFPMLTMVSSSSLDVKLPFSGRDAYLPSPYCGYPVVLPFVFLQTGFVLDFETLGSKEEYKEWFSTELTPTDGIVPYDCQMYLLDHLNNKILKRQKSRGKHNKILHQPFIVDTDHSTIIGVLSKSFTVRLIWKNVLEWLEV
jgi:hypothetical protein